MQIQRKIADVFKSTGPGNYAETPCTQIVPDLVRARVEEIHRTRAAETGVTCPSE